MSKSQENSNERIKIALAVLRKKIEDVLKLEPRLMEINSLDEIESVEKRKVIENQLWDIFSYGEYYVEKLMSDISTPMLSVKNKGNFDYHRETYKPLVNKIHELINMDHVYSRKEFETLIVKIKEHPDSINHFLLGWSPVILQSEIDKYLDVYHRICFQGSMCRKWLEDTGDPLGLFEIYRDTPNSIQSNIESALHATSCYLEGLEYENREIWEESIDLSVCENFLKKPYFKPDDWVANESALDPVIVTQEMEKIPTHIKTRIDEIYHSFIFGNWMSVIALSRCLLEYALIHRKSLLGKKLNKKLEFQDQQGRTKRLGELASIAGDAFPELKNSMEIVIEYGNYVMHPARRTIPKKNLAKHCFDEIQEIISVLYSN